MLRRPSSLNLLLALLLLALLTPLTAANENKEEEKKLETERAKNTNPSLPLGGYAGTYTGQM